MACWHRKFCHSMIIQGLILCSSDPSFILLSWLRSFGPLLPLFPTAPDLAASDFQVFCYLKHHLGGNHYNEDENSCELLVKLTSAGQLISAYEQGIQNLVSLFKIIISTTSSTWKRSHCLLFTKNYKYSDKALITNF